MSGNVIGVDLAIDPASIGLCRMDGNKLTFPKANETVKRSSANYHARWRDKNGGRKEAEEAAGRWAEYLVGLGADVLVMDGPQSLACGNNDHRRAEGILRTSGSTPHEFRLPKTTNNRTYSWPGLIPFSVFLFEKLEEKGYQRVREPGKLASRAACEFFPNASWNCFHSEISEAGLRGLIIAKEVEIEGTPNEHELDAAIGIMTIRAHEMNASVWVGEPLTISQGFGREGYIVVPDPGRKW